MLRINDNRMNLDLTVTAYIRAGKVACPVCGGNHGQNLISIVAADQPIVDPLYGSEAHDRVCDFCGREILIPVRRVPVSVY